MNNSIAITAGALLCACTGNSSINDAVDSTTETVTTTLAEAVAPTSSTGMDLPTTETAIAPRETDIEKDFSEIDIEKDFTIANISDSLFAVMQGKSYHNNSPVKHDDLRYLTVYHVTAEGDVKKGELICNKKIARDLIEIFRELYIAKYPIEKIGLIDQYGGDDERSMADNNTSCYNCRKTTGGTKYSRHAYGTAIDINPKYNPYIWRKGEKTVVSPACAQKYADRSIDTAYTIKKGDACYKAFVKRGFRWGGDWRSSKDYQHFEK